MVRNLEAVHVGHVIFLVDGCWAARLRRVVTATQGGRLVLPMPTATMGIGSARAARRLLATTVSIRRSGVARRLMAATVSFRHTGAAGRLMSNTTMSLRHTGTARELACNRLSRRVPSRLMLAGAGLVEIHGFAVVFAIVEEMDLGLGRHGGTAVLAEELGGLAGGLGRVHCVCGGTWWLVEADRV